VGIPNNSDWTKVLGWPGYRVFQREISERGKRLKLWVRRKKTGLKLICSGCGRHVRRIHEVYEREVRDLPVFQYTTTIVVELHRVRCPRCGVKAEKVAQLPSKAPFSKRFEEAVGGACESAAASQVAKRFGLPASTVRAIDQRQLERWAGSRRKPVLKQAGIDELYLGKSKKFITVVSNLETGEPLWFGEDRKKETLDGFFRSQLRAPQRRRLEAACVDMWKPFQQSLAQWAPNCAII
jgi:transposase